MASPSVAVPRGRTARATAVFTYAAALAVLIFGPPLLSFDFGPYRLLRTGDVLDLVTPLAALPVAWLLLRRAADGAVSQTQTLLFLALGAMWFQAQGMHLAANAIGNLGQEASADINTLTHYLDEVLSHYVWHAALIGISLLVGLTALRLPKVAMTGPDIALTAGAALLYGFTVFVMVVEGGTGWLGVPAATLLGAGGLAMTGRSLLQRPIVAAFVLAYLLSLVLFVVWAGLNGWHLIEFSELGWI